MYKFTASITKELRLLLRDKVGLMIMFAMPVLLVLLITSIQISAFELVNNSKVKVLLCNKDKGKGSQEFLSYLNEVGRFDLINVDMTEDDRNVGDYLNDHDAFVALYIPEGFSDQIAKKAEFTAGKALVEFGINESPDTLKMVKVDSLTIYFHPVLQQSLRRSIQGALKSVIQLVESKSMLNALYFSINGKPMPASFEKEMFANQIGIKERTTSHNGSRTIPNAAQHNVPAWTIFAMFFMVISLGGNIVKEKLSGSFVRLKILPTNFIVGLLSKQLLYLMVAMSQVIVIFSMGVWLFPHIGLPALNIPHDWLALIVVSFICGLSAISYALCIGVYAKTQEQANGFGAISVVILATIGGILVPSFAMPKAFQFYMNLSPLHWCLEAYYGLFLEGGKLVDIMASVIPLLGSIVVLQLIAIIGLKKKNLI
ncbi:MAG: transporter permease subunit [Chitinophagaceae bacterium]|nr:transporter permease subunit [Chitinophagaceae bacterium]